MIPNYISAINVFHSGNRPVAGVFRQDILRNWHPTKTSLRRLNNIVSDLVCQEKASMRPWTTGVVGWYAHIREDEDQPTSTNL